MIQPESPSYFKDMPSGAFGETIQPFFDSREKKVNSVGTAILRHLPSFLEKTIEKHQISKAVNSYLKNVNKAEKFLPTRYPDLFENNKSHQEQVKEANKKIFLHDLNYLKLHDLLLIKSLSSKSLNSPLTETFLEAINEKIASQQPSIESEGPEKVTSRPAEATSEKQQSKQEALNEQSKQLKNAIEEREPLSNKAINLLLTNTQTLDLIDNWAKKQRMAENLLFLRELENFNTAIIEIGEPKAKQEKAQEFFARFLATNAKTQVNVSGEVREQILEKIEKGDVTDKLFQSARDQIVSLYREALRADWGKNESIRQELAKRLGLSE